jgi:glycosyltransferase involved in cell wall biosynthesis
MLRVLALLPKPIASPSGRYRAFQLKPALFDHGIDLEIRSLLDAPALERVYRPGRQIEKMLDLVRGMRRRLEDIRHAEDFALVFVHREAWPLIGFRVDRRLARRRIPWIFDFDDAVFLPNVSEANRLVSWLKPFDQPARLVAGARAVAAGNAWLAEWARRQRPGRSRDDIEVIPSAVDTDRWAPRARDPGPPRLVWIGTPWTAPYLKTLRPAIERLGERIPDLEFHVIGGDFHAANIRVVLHRWSVETEIDLVGRCDVGLAPLPDNDWSRGKCGLKLLLYMALGLAAVASPIGVHQEIIAHRANGWLAPSPEAFAEGAEALLRDPELRARLGAAARATVEARYSIHAVAPRLAALMRRAAEEAR